MKVKDEERKAEIGKEIRKIYKNEENKIVAKLEKKYWRANYENEAM